MPDWLELEEAAEFKSKMNAAGEHVKAFACLYLTENIRQNRHAHDVVAGVQVKASADSSEIKLDGLFVERRAFFDCSVTFDTDENTAKDLWPWFHQAVRSMLNAMTKLHGSIIVLGSIVDAVVDNKPHIVFTLREDIKYRTTDQARIRIHEARKCVHDLFKSRHRHLSEPVRVGDKKFSIQAFNIRIGSEPPRMYSTLGEYEILTTLTYDAKFDRPLPSPLFGYSATLDANATVAKSLKPPSVRRKLAKWFLDDFDVFAAPATVAGIDERTFRVAVQIHIKSKEVTA